MARKKKDCGGCRYPESAEKSETTPPKPVVVPAVGAFVVIEKVEAGYSLTRIYKVKRYARVHSLATDVTGGTVGALIEEAPGATPLLYALGTFEVVQ